MVESIAFLIEESSVTMTTNGVKPTRDQIISWYRYEYFLSRMEKEFSMPVAVHYSTIDILDEVELLVLHGSGLSYCESLLERTDRYAKKRFIIGSFLRLNELLPLLEKYSILGGTELHFDPGGPGFVPIGLAVRSDNVIFNSEIKINSQFKPSEHYAFLDAEDNPDLATCLRRYLELRRIPDQTE